MKIMNFHQEVEPKQDNDDILCFTEDRKAKALLLIFHCQFKNKTKHHFSLN